MKPLKIAPGNSKLGKIANLSTAPVVTCSNCKKCAKTCYARKAYRMYKETKKAWDWNTRITRENTLEEIAYDIVDYCYSKAPKYFRLHVSGDVESQKQLDSYKLAARACRDTRFLLFTKNFSLDYSNLPKNFKVVFSMFPGMENQNVPAGSIAYAGDCDKIRRGRVFDCPGHCDNCGMCWNLRNDEHVHFHMH